MWLCYKLKFTCTAIFVAMEVGFLSTIVSSFILIFKLYCAGGVKPEGHTDSHDVIDMRLVIITWSYYRHRTTIFKWRKHFTELFIAKLYVIYIYLHHSVQPLAIHIPILSAWIKFDPRRIDTHVILVITQYFFLKLPAAAIEWRTKVCWILREENQRRQNILTKKLTFYSEVNEV